MTQSRSGRCSQDKGAYSSSWNSPQNYGTSLVNRITQYYLLPDRGDRPAFTPTGQVGTRFIDPVRMKGWVGLVGWLHTEMVYPSTDVIHPSTNQVWRSAITLIEANALPLSQTANQRWWNLTINLKRWQWRGLPVTATGHYAIINDSRQILKLYVYRVYQCS